MAQDDHFFSEQNARVALNAERYYRTMFGGCVESWNLRDEHMADTIDVLTQYPGGGRRPRLVVVEARAPEHTGEPVETYPTGM